MDALTYSGNLNNFRTFKNDKFFTFVQGDITNENDIKSILEKYKPNSVINFAAETHVDRSISGPESFIKTNIFEIKVRKKNVRLSKNKSTHLSGFYYFYINNITKK